MQKRGVIRGAKSSSLETPTWSAFLSSSAWVKPCMSVPNILNATSSEYFSKGAQTLYTRFFPPGSCLLGSGLAAST